MKFVYRLGVVFIGAATFLAGIYAAHANPANAVNLSNDPAVKILRFVPDGKWHMIQIVPDVEKGDSADPGIYQGQLDGVAEDTMGDCLRYQGVYLARVGGNPKNLVCVYIPK